MLDGVQNKADYTRHFTDKREMLHQKRRHLNEWENGVPSKKQIGGTHYAELTIQPSEFIFKNKLNWLEGNAIKYICRHNSKGGIQDIDKAIHYLELLKEWKYEQTEAEQEIPDPAF
jgi:hypothetical protein